MPLTPTSKKPYRLRALANATTHIGVHEQPAGSNHGPHIDGWCYRANGIKGGYPWCAAFMYSMFGDAGIDLHTAGLEQPSFVESWVKLGRDRGWVNARPFRGDVVCFDWGADGLRDHIGIVERVLAVRWRRGRFVGWVRSIEGNTSARSDSNGGEVQRRWRWHNGAQVYLRIPG